MYYNVLHTDPYEHKRKIEKKKRKLNIYNYFEKGCRKRCTQQSQKALWVV